MGRIFVAKTSDIPAGKTYRVSVDGHDIMVVNIKGQYFACDDTCTHSGASLSEGTLQDHTITCGWHGAKFDCTTGKLEKFPAKIKDLKTYKTVVESDSIFIEV